uniref:Uncharacterized protein ycf35 n=1 Tax=Inkyuleea mariana TaxID=123988 RepID=A0A4D6X274_9FLOR|nr:hypothetical protein [Inkyuleea mariana]
MSHFSRIKTSIYDLDILKKTLIDLGFTYKSDQSFIQDANGNSQKVDIIAYQMINLSKGICGFTWNGCEYSLITDLEFWNQNISIEVFIEKLMQYYALNSIMKESIHEGFQKINQETMQDGSIKLVIQRWN